MRYLPCIFSALLAYLFCLPSFASPEVNAPDGLFVGKLTDSGRQFLGIPYAQPPTGALRWAAPKALPAATSPRVAQEFGADCVQPKEPTADPQPGLKMTGSEDCLFLNIYSASDAPNQPVMVWIHGGAFVFGSGREIAPHVLVQKHNVMVVTLNYRLGALGFLSLRALGRESGNFGILDQQMALAWVQRNIAAFGGDAKRVTIFGESAGGVSVCMQLLSPSAKGLFSRAINQSGPCKVIHRSITDKGGEHYAKQARCEGRSGRATLDCLRKIPADQAAAFSPGAVGLGDTAWQPSYGTPVIPKDARALEAGQFNRVDIINGSNRDEGRLFALGALTHLPDEQAYARNLAVQFKKNAQKVLGVYPAAKSGSPVLAYATYMTDWLFACPAYRASQAMARYVNVYAYEFSDRDAPITLKLPPEIGSFGAYHTAEMQYIFQTAAPDFARPESFTPAQRRLSENMQEAWANFARDGVPSISGESPWPRALPYAKPRELQMRNFNPSGAALVEGFSKDHQCDFWKKL